MLRRMNFDKCPTCGRRKTRSSEANRRYWALVAKLVDKPVQGHHYSKDTWHEYLKSKFLGSEEIALPNGKTVIHSKDSSGLSITEFSEYMSEVEAWCATHGVWLDE